MLDISKPFLPLLVSAVDDAVKYNQAGLKDATDAELADHEEHLLNLSIFQSWLEAEYRRLQASHPDMLAYERLVR